MISRVIYAFLSVGILGGLLGLALAYASKIFAVKKDKRITDLEEILPGANCGACGYPGCSGYAEAIVNEGAEMTLCAPGGADVASKVGEIMGVTVEVSGEKMVAQIHCHGTRDTSKVKYDYKGINDCNAMHSSFGGDKSCPYGCLGLGSCIKVCPVDAISKTDAGYLNIDKDKCIACGKCINVCPTGVIKMIPYSAKTIVACNSKDKGGIVRKYCSVGCIGCKMCEKKSPDGGFKVENFLAYIDYSAEGSRTEAIEACPAKCIKNLDEAQ
ncbi:MAG: RnfABCDGE type electron transport complex subunit B [Spirochaetales bacterium]|nr:RnfABCDGE type electron transport complex subunit B [Spirochaetales bacterium]